MATKTKAKRKVKRTRTKRLLPDEFVRKSMVESPVPAAQGGPLRGSYQYIVETRRHEGNWRVHVQWVEIRGAERLLVAQVVDLPHEVCIRLYSQRDQILKESVHEGHKKAHRTRASAPDLPEPGNEVGGHHA